jgi:hypothetical protein
MEDHSKVKLNQIHPNRETYVALLNCLSRSQGVNTGKLATDIMQEIGRSSSAEYRNLDLNQGVYALAMKVCLEMGDFDRLDTLMRVSGTALKLIAYLEIVRRRTGLATRSSIELAEQIISHMQVHSLSGRPDLRPTSEFYRLLIKAWSTYDVPESSERMWQVYTLMLDRDKVMDSDLYALLISRLCMTGCFQSVERADFLLKQMETNQMRNTEARRKHYEPVVKAWLRINHADKATEAMMRSIETHLQNVRRDSIPCSYIVCWVVSANIRSGNLRDASLMVFRLNTLNVAGMLPNGPVLGVCVGTLHAAWKGSDSPDRDSIEKLEKILGITGRNQDTTNIEERKSHDSPSALTKSRERWTKSSSFLAKIPYVHRIEALLVSLKSVILKYY